MDNLIQTKLAQGRYRLTRQRQVILDVMKESRGKHLTAEEILEAARKKAANISMATVYRTIERLTSLSILYKIRLNDNRFRYELADKAQHQHHHINCLHCGKIFELEEGLLDSVEKKVKKQGFTVINHRLTILAVCPECTK